MKRIFLLVMSVIFFSYGFHVLQNDNLHFNPGFTKIWHVDSLNALHIPLADTTIQVEFLPEEYYYQLEERKVYKSYPFYLKSEEPENYWAWLKDQQPEITFNPATLKTKEDWIEAGELAYEAPILIFPVQSDFASQIEEVAKVTGIPVGKEGIFPYYSYVIREKGKVEIGMFSCGMCHNRVMPDGSVIKGAQGTFNQDRMDGFAELANPQQFKEFRAQIYDAPWVDPVQNFFRQMEPEEIRAELQAMPNGVMLRHGSAPHYPTTIPDLIGIKDRKYLDHTGLIQHRGPADLMRYGALNQTLDMFNSYNGFIPSGVNSHSERPPVGQGTFVGTSDRYSEEQLYAITQYLYALEPPENPYKFDPDLLVHGEKLFIQEGCVTCHTPPLYTNNTLTPVDGFEPPASHFEQYDIFNVSVETDPGLALYTRRGTGYYRVPSLKGLWYRGPLGHSGEIATLEDWLDPRRLEDDYIPTGYKPAGTKTKAVKGHDFGLTLGTDDRKALIAYLRSL